jgi:diaminopimelate decarboxylase
MRQWWRREDLQVRGDHLYFGGEEVEGLALSAGTPLYLYHGDRTVENIERLETALAGHALDYRLFYAVKSNRFMPLLTRLKTLGKCGVDVCSPGELILARQAGFREREISFTGTAVSDADLDCLQRHPDVWVNCDSLSSIRRLGSRCAGREIGLRINPGLGIGYATNELLRYSGSKTTKFGIYRQQFDHALELAASCDLEVKGLHFHTGCGYLDPQLPVFDEILGVCSWFADRVSGLEHVNIGGGLGVPLTAEDNPLDLERWCELLERHLGRRGLQVWIEPGDYIVRDAGMLVVQVNTVEEKESTIFVGVDGGFNVNMAPAFYRLPLEVIPCRQHGGDDDGAPSSPGAASRASASSSTAGGEVTIAGNINEALDILAENVHLPSVKEGDFLAFLNAGGYGASMSSDHCLRGGFLEYLV